MKQSLTQDSSKKVDVKKRDGALGVRCVCCGITFFKVEIFLAHSCVTGGNRDRMA